jgi:hypothetical protein
MFLRNYTGVLAPSPHEGFSSLHPLPALGRGGPKSSDCFERRKVSSLYSAALNKVFRAALLLSFGAAALLIQVSHGLADGGVLLMKQSSGALWIAVFTEPAPLRAGLADISVLIQDRDSQQPVLNAEVMVVLHRKGRETIRTQARREQAKNRLLYAALLNLPEAGRWEMEVTVVRNSEEAKISGVMTVAPPRPFLLTYGWPLAFPPISIGLFVMNQWLKRHPKGRWKR